MIVTFLDFFDLKWLFWAPRRFLDPLKVWGDTLEHFWKIPKKIFSITIFPKEIHLPCWKSLLQKIAIFRGWNHPKWVRWPKNAILWRFFFTHPPPFFAIFPKHKNWHKIITRGHINILRPDFESSRCILSRYDFVDAKFYVFHAFL